MSYDVIVVGLGAMGSATAYQAARRGARVLGLEAFTPAHELGSSGGQTRIIRLAYFEHPAYVPLLRAAWEMWPRIAEEADRELMLVTGGLYAGRRGSAVLEGALASAQQHGLAHEMLGAQETRERFPALTVDDDMQTLHEPLAGILFAQRCIAAHLELAARHGAELRFEERVTGWQADGDGIRVTTNLGSYTGAKLVVAAGAWLPELAPELKLPLTVERNVNFWFEPVASPELLSPARLPVWIVELDDEHAFYGFPMLPAEAGLGEGAKVSRHHGGTSVDPHAVDREARPEDEAPVRDFIKQYLPLANGPRLDARVCMYTNTPDFNFVLDFHPADSRVVIASPCSGHGFKFSNVIGRVCADLALDGQTSFDIDFLSIRR
ncbi:MAG: N-methyl-L-tryptophan oxidase, partial [Chloroflexota bacterium]